MPLHVSTCLGRVCRVAMKLTQERLRALRTASVLLPDGWMVGGWMDGWTNSLMLVSKKGLHHVHVCFLMLDASWWWQSVLTVLLCSLKFNLMFFIFKMCNVCWLVSCIQLLLKVTSSNLGSFLRFPFPSATWFEKSTNSFDNQFSYHRELTRWSF